MEIKSENKTPRTGARISRLAVACKLLNDILFLSLISFALFLTAESALPESVSTYLNFTKCAVIIFIIFAAVVYAGKKITPLCEISGTKKRSRALIILLASFSIFLIANSLIKFDWKEIIVITLAAFLILFYFYEIYSGHSNAHL